MVIPTNPSLSDIAAEYGDSAPYSLSDFLGKPGAPVAFPASFSDWAGLSDVTLRIDVATYTDNDNWPGGTAEVQIVFGSDGGFDRALGGAAAVWQYDWVVPTGDAGDYHVYANLISGTLTSGTTGSWLAMTSQRSWYKSNTNIGTATVVIDFSLSDDGGSTTVYGPKRITIEAIINV